MLSLSDNNQADIIEAFNSTSRYSDDLLNIDNPYFEQMVGQIYPTELQLNLVYKFKRIVGEPNFSDQFIKIVKRYIRVGYNLDIMRQSACLVLNPKTHDSQIVRAKEIKLSHGGSSYR